MKPVTTPKGRRLPRRAVVGQPRAGQQQTFPGARDGLIEKLCFGAFGGELQGQIACLAQPLPIGIPQERVLAQGRGELSLGQTQ